jgi:hypothetical protein
MGEIGRKQHYRTLLSCGVVIYLRGGSGERRRREVGCKLVGMGELKGGRREKERRGYRRRGMMDKIMTDEGGWRVNDGRTARGK